MPDASGQFKGIAVPAGAWERIFGKPEATDTEAKPRPGAASDAPRDSQ